LKDSHYTVARRYQYGISDGAGEAFAVGLDHSTVGRILTLC
jgi:hypothetical protein